ncbi:septum formation family protein [Mycobacterium sp. IDR2000157661]|nr:septum formation family protein [Mycobacterium sp. IDR2000157661]
MASSPRTATRPRRGYPPPPPPPYSQGGPGYYGQPPAQNKTNWWAIVSLIFGLIGGVLISVVCGIVGLKKAKDGQGGRGLAIAGLVLSALWTLAIIAILAFVVLDAGTVTATDVQEGDCLSEIPGDTRVRTVKTVDCAEPHAGEVFAVLQMPDGDFPGQAVIDSYTERCSPELARYSPAAMEDDAVQLYVLYPTAETWAEGDRAVTCIATLNPPRAGSLKG